MRATAHSVCDTHNSPSAEKGKSTRSATQHRATPHTCTSLLCTSHTCAPVSLIHSFIQVTHSARTARTRTVCHEFLCTRFRSRLLSTCGSEHLFLPFALGEPPRLSSFLRYVVSYGTRFSFFLCGLTFEYFFVFFFLFARFFGYGYFYVILFRTCISYAFHATGDMDSPRCCLVSVSQILSNIGCSGLGI